MAFDLGQRVSSSFTGIGTVTGELTKDEDKVCLQEITFDNPALGTRNYEIRKLSPVHEEGGSDGTKA